MAKHKLEDAVLHSARPHHPVDPRSTAAPKDKTPSFMFAWWAPCQGPYFFFIRVLINVNKSKNYTLAPCSKIVPPDEPRPRGGARQKALGQPLCPTSWRDTPSVEAVSKKHH